MADFLIGQADDAHAGYVASARVTGRIGNRGGAFVIQQGGLVDGESPEPFGCVVPGSGTGGFQGLRSTVRFKHDEPGAIATLDDESQDSGVGLREIGVTRRDNAGAGSRAWLRRKAFRRADLLRSRRTRHLGRRFTLTRLGWATIQAVPGDIPQGLRADIRGTAGVARIPS